MSKLTPDQRATRATLLAARAFNRRTILKVVTGTGEKGFDVTVDRTVYDASGNQLRRDTFKSHYIPDSPTTVYGPGKTPPGPYIVLPSTL